MNNSHEIEIRELARELMIRVHECNTNFKAADSGDLMERCFLINSLIASGFANLTDSIHVEHMMKAISELDELRIHLCAGDSSLPAIAVRETLEALYIELELALIPIRELLAEEYIPKLEKVCI